MYIKYINNGTGKTEFWSIAPYSTAEDVAQALGYTDGTWEMVDEPDVIPLEEARAAKLAEVMAGYKAAFAPIEAAYPAEERETWPIQLEEARAYMADPSAETPMLSVMVATRGKGESVADFARIVMANNAAYRLIAGHLTGQQQRMYAEVNALETVGAIQAYEVAYAMPDNVDYAGM